MKKITVLAILTLIANIFTTNAIAQDGYTFTLVDNGSYSFSIAAVPNTSTSNFATSMQSYGFTIIVPDGVTIDDTNATSFGGGESATFFNGNDVGQPTIDGYLVTETLGAPGALPAPSAATNTVLYTFTVNGSPTSGNMYILENNSALANAVTPLKSFMQADMVDDNMVGYTNVVDPNAPAVTAPSTFNFASLSTAKNELNSVGIYPNPVKDVLNIQGLDATLNQVSIHTIGGKRVLTQTTNLEQINTSALAQGVYFVTLKSANATKTIKVVKN